MDSFNDGSSAVSSTKSRASQDVPNLHLHRRSLPRSTRHAENDKYKVLGNVAGLGAPLTSAIPAMRTAAIEEAFTTWVIPIMSAKVARGD